MKAFHQVRRTRGSLKKIFRYNSNKNLVQKTTKVLRTCKHCCAKLNEEIWTYGCSLTQRPSWLISNNSEKVEEDYKIWNGNSFFSTFQDCTICKDKWGVMCVDFNENFNDMMFLILRSIGLSIVKTKAFHFPCQ
jgi:hypothetical protein